MPNVESTYSSWPRRLTKYVAGLRPEYSIYGVSFALVLAFFGLFFLSAWGDYRHTLNQSYITVASYHKLLEEYILRTLNTMDILLAGEVEQIEMHLSSAEIRSPDYHNRLVRTANALPAIWGLSGAGRERCSRGGIPSHAASGFRSFGTALFPGPS